MRGQLFAKANRNHNRINAFSRKASVMNHLALATYLNDHLAGSVMAIELLNDLEASSEQAPLKSFAAELASKIEADQRQLQKIVEDMRASESIVRKSAAWFAEKATRLKLRVDDPGHGKFHQFEILEVLSLGIEGKRTLWRTLQQLAESVPALGHVDFEHLIQRAEIQRAQVECQRLAICREALTAEA
jgi:hypothetical protein